MVRFLLEAWHSGVLGGAARTAHSATLRALRASLNLDLAAPAPVAMPTTPATLRVTASGAPRISPMSVVVASRNQVSSDLAGETVLLSLADAHYYGLQGVGSRIWALLRQPVRVDEISATLAREYDVPAERCLEDALVFIGDLAAAGLVEVRDGA